MNKRNPSIFAGLALAVAYASNAHAIVIPTGGNDSVFLNRGLQYSADMKMGAIHGTNPSSLAINDSFVFLTNLAGDRYAIGDTPAAGSLWLGGYGNHGFQSQADQGQDGNARIGSGPRVVVDSDLFDNSLYAGVFFNPGTYGPDNVVGAQHDSGGGVWNGDTVVGVLSAVSSGNRTVFTRLDAIRDDLNSLMTDPTGIYGLTAAHVAKGATLDYVYLGNFNDPTLTLKVDSVYINPDWQSSFGGLDGSHSDYALVKLSVVPEPSIITILAVISLGTLRRRKA